MGKNLFRLGGMICDLEKFENLLKMPIPVGIKEAIGRVALTSARRSRGSREADSK
jgi:hypothetical protein